MLRKWKRTTIESEPIPGSLEEDLVYPEDYLKNSFETKLTDLRKHHKLNPLDVYNSNLHKDKSCKNFKLNKDTRKGRSSFKDFFLKNKSFFELTRQKVNKCDTSSDELMMQYKHIKSRLEISAHRNSLDTSKRTISQHFNEIKQNNSITRYENTQRDIKTYHQQVLVQIGRKACDSIINCSNTYRKRLEKAQMIEMKASTSILYGQQSWYMGLRNSSKNNESKHYTIPLNNGYLGMSVNITNIAKEVTVIRKHENEIEKTSHNNLVIKKDNKNKKVSKLTFMINNKNLTNLLVNYSKK